MCEILIVDDDYAIREMLQEALEDGGYRVVAVEHGSQALSYLHSAAQLPCLILLDLMMPVMSGWEFRMAQQKDDRLRTVPVIVLSARRGIHHDDYDIAADEFIAKPLNLDALLNAVAQYCE